MQGREEKDFLRHRDAEGNFSKINFGKCFRIIFIESDRRPREYFKNWLRQQTMKPYFYIIALHLQVKCFTVTSIVSKGGSHR